jgi:hypothetical protein
MPPSFTLTLGQAASVQLGQVVRLRPVAPPEVVVGVHDAEVGFEDRFDGLAEPLFIPQRHGDGP